jgi:GNAT superfamily N-acetyltransferase
VLQPQLKSPSICTHQELDAFRRLVELNGQASTARVPDSELLAFYAVENKTVAVGALKNPSENDLRGILNEKANISDDTIATLQLEIGYFSTHPDYRGQGHARKILSALLNEVPNRTIFATTGSPCMVHLLTTHGFIKHGESWPSEHANLLLSLYIRPAYSAG